MKAVPPISTPRPVPTLARPALLLILLLAFALRVYRLDAQSLWWDESLSVYRATRDWATFFANTILIQNVVTVDTLPQGYFFWLRLLVPLTGISEFALRFFSVAANVATIPLLYALARRWCSAPVGALAALLGALSPFYVWYAQEARPYALVLLWSTLAVYALTRGLDARRSTRPVSRWLIVYVFAAAASIYTHYYSIFLLPFHIALIAILVWRTPPARGWILLPALPLASAVLLIPQVIASMAGNVGIGPRAVPLDIILRDLHNSFSVGVTLDLEQAAWIDVTMLALLGVGLAFTAPKPNRGFGMREFRWGILAYLLVPVIVVYLASFLRPLYQNSRYLIAISPAFYVGVAAGIVALARRRRIWALAALGVFVVGAAMSLGNWYFDPRWGKDDHRAWAEYLRARVRPDDFLILNSPHTEELYRYYADAIVPMTTLPILRADGVPAPDADRVSVRDALARHARVWYLAMHVPFDDPQGRIEALLRQEGVLLEQVNFRGVSTGIALALYARALPIADANDIRYPLDIAFAGHLRLRGYDAPVSIAPGTRGVVTVYWQIGEPVGEDYAVSLRLVDDAGTRLAQSDTLIVGSRAGTSTWQPHQIVADANDLPVAASVPPGMYRLQIVPYHSATGAALGNVVTLCEIQVTLR